MLLMDSSSLPTLASRMTYKLDFLNVVPSSISGIEIEDGTTFIEWLQL